MSSDPSNNNNNNNPTEDPHQQGAEDDNNKDDVILSVAPSGAYEIVYVDSRSTFQAIETTINLATPPTLENIQKNHANRNFVYSGGLIAACSIPINNSSLMTMTKSGTSQNNSTVSASSDQQQQQQQQQQQNPSFISPTFQQHSRGVVPHGRGKLFYQDSGEMYEGEWVFGRREGRGLWIGPKIERKKKESGTSSANNAGNTDNQSAAMMGNDNNTADSGASASTANNNNNIAATTSIPSSVTILHQQSSLPERPSYEGEWKNDDKHGKGAEQFPDGRYYVGDFKNGVCTGNGSLTFPNGDAYRGMFNADGIPHDPRGEYTFANGGILSGAWVEGKRHGTFAVSFGSSPQHTYQGVFVNDQSMGITCLN